jgi:hypothetical protein
MGIGMIYPLSGKPVNDGPLDKMPVASFGTPFYF